MNENMSILQCLGVGNFSLQNCLVIPFLTIISLKFLILALGHTFSLSLNFIFSLSLTCIRAHIQTHTHTHLCIHTNIHTLPRTLSHYYYHHCLNAVLFIFFFLRTLLLMLAHVGSVWSSDRFFLVECDGISHAKFVLRKTKKGKSKRKRAKAGCTKKVEEQVLRSRYKTDQK